MRISMYNLSGWVLLIMAVFNGCSPGTVADEKKEVASAEVSNPAVDLPILNMKDIDGNAVNLQSLKGKKVFVNLWASWCPPCRAEMPSIQSLQQTVNKDKAVFVMLSLDESFDKAKQYINSSKIKLPFYYPAGNLPSLFNVPGIPATFIFDEQGKLIRKIEGGSDYDSDEFRNLLQ